MTPRHAIRSPRRRTKGARRLWRGAARAFPVAAFGVAAALLLAAVLGYRPYIITGRSMQGTIDLGSVVVARPVPVSTLEVGDIIVYRPPASSGVNRVITHRIASIEASVPGAAVMRTKGDANATADPWTFTLDRSEQARVMFHIPVLGFPLSLLTSRAWRLLLVGVPGALIGISAVADLLALSRGRRRSTVVTG